MKQAYKVKQARNKWIVYYWDAKRATYVEGYTFLSYVAACMAVKETNK